MHKLSESYKAFSLIRPTVLGTTSTGTGVDLMGYLDDASAIVNLGAASDTDATCIVTIQGSNDNSTYTTLTTFGTLTATDDNKLACGSVNLAGYRYVRAVATIAGTGTPSFTLDVVLMARAEAGSSSLNSTTAA